MDSELDNHIEQIEDDSSKANDTIQKHLSRVSQLITNQSKRNVARWRKNLLKTKRKTLLENKTLLKRVEALETELSKTNQELTKVKEKRDEDQKKHSEYRRELKECRIKERAENKAIKDTLKKQLSDKERIVKLVANDIEEQFGKIKQQKNEIDELKERLARGTRELEAANTVKEWQRETIRTQQLRIEELSNAVRLKES